MGYALDRAMAAKIEAEVAGPSRRLPIVFPIEPYPTQRQLAEAVIEAARSSQTVVFESPTGTGKTLAVLCGVLNCIRELQLTPERLETRIRNAQRLHQVELDERHPDYKRLHSLAVHLNHLEAAKEVFDVLERRLNESVEVSIERDRKNGRGKMIIRNRKVVDADEEDIDKDFHEFARDEEECQIERMIHKMYYVSRTHSQLSQFIKEMDNPVHKDFRPVHLGSRKAFCLNKSINGLPSTTLNCECSRLVRGSADIEDLAAGPDEPAKPKRSKKEGCPYFNMKRIYTMRNQILRGELHHTTIHELGEKNKACPYYAAKAAIPLSNVIAMPYNMLLDENCRKSYDIIIDENAVVVDEAHNFISTVQDIDSFNGNLSECELIRDALRWYLEKTKSTSQRKLFAARQTAEVLDRFIIVMRNFKEQCKDGKATELLPSQVAKKMETSTNFIQLAGTIERSELLMEGRIILNGWWQQKHMPHLPGPVGTPRPTKQPLVEMLRKLREEHAQKNPQSKNNRTPRGRAIKPLPRKKLVEVQLNTGAPESSGAGSSSFVAPAPTVAVVPQLLLDGIQELTKVTKLLRSLCSSRQDRFLLNADETFRYIRLDLNDEVLSVIRNARTFIMVGGTMRPKGFIANSLYRTDPRIAVQEKHFGHVIDRENLYPIIITNMPGVYSALSFYTSRLTDEVINNYATALMQVINNIPYGVVIFFPSYAVIPKFYEILKKSTKKEVIMETKESNADKLLERYKPYANSPTGAIMLASAAGKLGEGINFADNLARGVIMVGLPYPNITDPEIQLRAKYAVQNRICETETEYLEQCCVRVVAQCMGRAIRHANDYAAMVFMDARYKSMFSELLPEWMTVDLRQLQLYTVEPEFKNFFARMAEKYKK